MYLHSLRDKTLMTIDKLTQATVELILIFQNNNSSSFITNDRVRFLKPLSIMFENLRKLRTSIVVFYESTLKHVTLPIFGEVLYAKLFKFLPLIELTKYDIDKDSTDLIDPALGILEIISNNLTTKYKLLLKDSKELSPMYHYFTDFSFLNSLEYQKYLFDKYGQDFIDTLLIATKIK